jgi:hypothetical protein
MSGYENITIESYPGAGPAPESTEETAPPSSNEGDDGVSGE